VLELRQIPPNGGSSGSKGSGGRLEFLRVVQPWAGELGLQERVVQKGSFEEQITTRIGGFLGGEPTILPGQLTDYL
jgi:hypothetical protein